MKADHSRAARPSAGARQGGMSLLEAIAYLGVASTIVAGALALLSTAFSSARSIRAQEEVTAISTGVRRLFMSQPDGYGTGILNEQLIKARIFPSTLAVHGELVTNAWNGAVEVAGNAASFGITYTDIPQEVCIELIATPGQWIGIAVNGAAVTPPVSVAQAAQACNQSTANRIAWTAR